MKRVFALMIFVFCTTTFWAQSKVGESWKTTMPRDFQEYNRVSKIARVSGGAATTQSVPSGAKFTIYDETSLADHYIIYFWLWPSGNAYQASLNFETGGSSQIKYFVIRKDELELFARRLYRIAEPTLGALTFPFKYRPQNGKFETTFGIGASGGVTFNPYGQIEHQISFLLGVGSSSARVDQYNTDPAANITTPSERTAITFSLNAVYQWQRLQIGLSMGFDNILDNEELKWRQQGKPWFSIGIGVNIFTIGEGKAPTSKEN